MTTVVFNTYLWTHNPDLSAAPKDLLNHFYFEEGSYAFEAAVIKLENEKFLYITYTSTERGNPEVGLTDYEEFDTREEADTIYEVMIGGIDEE